MNAVFTLLDKLLTGICSMNIEEIEKLLPSTNVYEGFASKNEFVAYYTNFIDDCKSGGDIYLHLSIKECGLCNLGMNAYLFEGKLSNKAISLVLNFENDSLKLLKICNYYK